jgi:L-threonylcarbamoyladenylate synthase
MSKSAEILPTHTPALFAVAVQRAAELLRQGHLVGMPTETVYGLAANAFDPAAVARIYAVKGRPANNPIIVHVASAELAHRCAAVWPEAAQRLATTFWPGPLTIVVPRRTDCPVSELALAGLDSIALRIPSAPEALALLKAAGKPIAAPSANRSGRVSPTTPEHVLEDLDGLIDAVVMGPSAEVGVESTIVSCLVHPPVMLRPGGLPREAIEAELGWRLADPVASDDDQAAPLAPGMLLSHYAPRAKVRLNVQAIEEGEAALLFGLASMPGIERSVATLNISPSGNLAEAAAELFGALRTLDASGASSIAVAPVPSHGLGEAINDRLHRAAAPRN